MHAVEDPKPIDDFDVLPVVQDLQLCANRIRHQLLRLEVDLSADEVEVTAKGSECQASLSLLLPLTVKLPTLKALTSRMLLVPRCLRMFLVG